MLDEDLPDHSSLTRTRQRLGVDVFQCCFEQVVDLCQEVGHIRGRELHVDATKVDANADLLADDALRDTAKTRPDASAEQEVMHRADAATCNACALKVACSSGEHGRIVHRSFYADDVEMAQTYHATKAYKKAIRKRQVWVEPLFAEAKDWRGVRRLRLRDQANANIEGLLIATGQNLKRLLAATGWGRSHAPCGSLMALPRERWRLSVVFA